MRRLMLLAGVLFLSGLLFVSCSKAPSQAPSVGVAAPREMTAPAPMPPAQEDYSKAGVLTATVEERMIVRNGDISLVVDDVVEARDEIAQLAVGFGGFVVSSWISGEEQERRGNISFPAPDDKFEPALAELRRLAVRVKSESTNSQDVTEQYVDLQSRLKNAEATENQYLTILEKARDVEDILRVYDSLSRVRSEIEQIKGRMQYLERTSSMSLISVQLEPAATAKGLVRPGWSAIEVLKSAVRGVVVFGQTLATIALWLVVLSPVWGTILGIILWRRRRKKASA